MKANEQMADQIVKSISILCVSILLTFIVYFNYFTGLRI